MTQDYTKVTNDLLERLRLKPTTPGKPTSPPSPAIETGASHVLIAAPRDCVIINISPTVPPATPRSSDK